MNLHLTFMENIEITLHTINKNTIKINMIIKPYLA